MATVPPSARKVAPRRSLADMVSMATKAIASRRTALTPIQAAAAWLRGDAAKFDSIRNLILARVEARAMSPVPSEPTAALADKARDYEARSILAELEMIYRSPLPHPIEGDRE